MARRIFHLSPWVWRLNNMTYCNCVFVVQYAISHYVKPCYYGIRPYWGAISITQRYDSQSLQPRAWRSILLLESPYPNWSWKISYLISHITLVLASAMSGHHTANFIIITVYFSRNIHSKHQYFTHMGTVWRTAVSSTLIYDLPFQLPCYMHYTGIILGMSSANERRRSNVMSIHRMIPVIWDRVTRQVDCIKHAISCFLVVLETLVMYPPSAYMGIQDVNDEMHCYHLSNKLAHLWTKGIFLNHFKINACSSTCPQNFRLYLKDLYKVTQKPPENVLLRFPSNFPGTFPQGYPKTIREHHLGMFLNVWGTFHFNVMGTLHGNDFFMVWGEHLGTLWKCKVVGWVANPDDVMTWMYTSRIDGRLWRDTTNWLPS